jgi:branched-chain amino acid transport system substrate-binding protein
MGTWTAPNLGKKAILASSFYDSGYDTLYAFRLGFEGAGGQILSTHVTDTPGREGGMSEFITELKRERPDFVYALYCGQDAIAFMKAWEESGLSGKIPLAGSGFFVDESLLSAHGHAAQRTRSSFPWSPVLELPENKAFVHSYRERTGRHADAFSMLGYETARLIMQAVHAVSGETRKTDALIAALGDAQFASPRGRFKMDSRTHTSRSPLYLREVERSGSSFSNKVISELNPVNDEDDLVTAMQTGFRTGWLNAYLSV